MNVDVWHVLWVAILTDLATGLGVLPLAFMARMSNRWQGITSAVAGGMMISASVFSLADQGMHRGHPSHTMLGMLAGALFLAATSRWLSGHEWHIGNLSATDSRRAALVVLAMFLHSIPEGMAVGVGYGTGELRFGFLLALAIAAQNVPEGTAVAIPLRAKGISLPACFGYALLTSLPQPLFAVPSYLLVSSFQKLLPAGLGFAGGAMIYLVAVEMLPDSYEVCSREDVGWGVMVGLVVMLALTSWLNIA